jgi:hypothetical protein
MPPATEPSQSNRLAHQTIADFSEFKIRSQGKIFYYQADGACTIFDTKTKSLIAYEQEDRRRDLYAECQMIQTFLDKRCRSILLGIANYLRLSRAPSANFIEKCASFFQVAIRLTSALISKEDQIHSKAQPLSKADYDLYGQIFSARSNHADPILPSELTKRLRKLRTTNDPILTQSFPELEKAEQILYKLAHRDTNSSTYQMLLHHKAQKIEVIEPRLRTITETSQQSQKPFKLQISAYISQGGGTAGLAKLVARDLQHRLPGLQVQLDIVGENNSTRIFGMNDSVATHLKRPDCILNIGFGVMVCQRSPNIPDITFDTLPREMDAENALLQNQLMTLDLTSAFGAVPFDQSLASRRSEADTWDRSKLTAQREAWLCKALTEEVHTLITEHCHGSLSSCGWGFGYYQDSNGFLQGVDKVIAWHKEHLTPEQKLLYFVIDGKHAGYIHGTVRREDIAARGARVIDTQTNTIYNPTESSAVTFCFLDSLNHDHILTLLSELHGLPIKETYQTGQRSFWAQTPALVTGNASAFEAISAALPIIHDSFDAGVHGFDLAAKHLTHMLAPNSEWILSHSDKKLPPIRNLTLDGRQISFACSYRDLGSECILQIARRLSATDASLLA